jgi:cell division septum initiation protein DivIVA
MDILEILIEKLNKMSRDFEAVLRENQRLNQKIDELREQNDILIKNSQDAILTIKNKLKEEI